MVDEAAVTGEPIPVCKIFQDVAAGIHDGDDDSRQILPEYKRSRHGDEGNRVNPYATRQEVADHRRQ